MDGRAEVASHETSTVAVTLQEQREQLEKVLHSETFKAARGLQKFLDYVASKTIAGLADEIKEYTIGTEVFGRAADYDPRVDTVVRVQALRLREKLREYYDREGATDEVRLIVPKGHYIPRFTRRAAPSAAELGSSSSSMLLPPGLTAGNSASESGAVAALVPPPRREHGKRALRWLRVGLATLVFIGLGLLVIRSKSRRSPQVGDGSQQARAHVMEAGSFPVGLWADFIRNESSPIVAYSNDVFLKTESSDLLRVRDEEIGNLGATPTSDVASRLSLNRRLLLQAGPVSVDDSYTGTGEVMAVFYLTRMFGQFHTVPQVKRSRLVTVDDLSRHDLIFLGSPRENAFLAGLPLTQDFVFAWPQPASAWKGRIINLHPQPGETAFYEIQRDPRNHVMRTDYALVSFLPGITPARKIVALGGITTLGTQAAADFATSPAGMTEIAERFGTGPPGARQIPSFFQVLLKVEVMKGDILSVNYVTGHVMHTFRSLAQKD